MVMKMVVVMFSPRPQGCSLHDDGDNSTILMVMMLMTIMVTVIMVIMVMMLMRIVISPPPLQQLSFLGNIGTLKNLPMVTSMILYSIKISFLKWWNYLVDRTPKE